MNIDPNFFAAQSIVFPAHVTCAHDTASSVGRRENIRTWSCDSCFEEWTEVIVTEVREVTVNQFGRVRNFRDTYENGLHVLRENA